MSSPESQDRFAHSDSRLKSFWIQLGCIWIRCAVATDNKLQLRLPLILHAYLADLADMGTFGKGKNGVAIRFIEDGIQRAIERGAIPKRSAREFEDTQEDGDA
jgi:hypothetical protein